MDCWKSTSMGPQVGQAYGARGQAVVGQHRQDKKRGGERNKPACRREGLLAYCFRALHPGAPLCGGQGRSEVSYQAEDSCPTRGAGNRRWDKVSRGGGLQLLWRGRRLQAVFEHGFGSFAGVSSSSKNIRVSLDAT